MLLRFVFGLSLAIGVYSRSSHLGQYAKVIHAREIHDEAEYDFIIAGGGIAGLTVADRLTENTNGKGTKILQTRILTFN